MEVNDKEMGNLINRYNSFSLFKGPTCCKTSKGRSIDRMPTNKKHSFMKSQSFEAGFSDHHYLIYTIFKSTFVKLSPRIIRYREFKNFSMEGFQTDLENSLRSTNSFDYQLFHSMTKGVLQKHAPLKQRVIGGNEKSHKRSNLRKAIMTRIRLRNQANMYGFEDYKKYKRRRNLVVSMNRKARR